MIWARATARRDGSRRSPDDALPAIRRALATPGAILRRSGADASPTAFVLVVPAGERWEVRYLAVVPEAWGRGIGTALLTEIADSARAAGIGRLELWVLAANARALGVYARSGWRRTGDTKSQLDSRRTEERLERTVGPPGRDPVPLGNLPGGSVSVRRSA